MAKQARAQEVECVSVKIRRKKRPDDFGVTFVSLEDGERYEKMRTTNKGAKQYRIRVTVGFLLSLSLSLVGLSHCEVKKQTATATAGAGGKNNELELLPEAASRGSIKNYKVKKKKQAEAASRRGILPPRVGLVYIVSHDDPHTQKKVSEMQDAFQDRFVVVWDNNEKQSCPFAKAICIDGMQISQSRRFNFICCGLEKAATWSIAQTATKPRGQRFDYVWFMEDDVEYSDISELVRIVDDTASEAHLLYQEDNLTWVDDEWYWGLRVARDTKIPNLFGNTPIVHGMFNLFRMSSKLLKALDKVYHKNGDSWVYFEAMIPTTALRYGLSSKSWPALQPQSEYFLRYRPCYTDLPKKGIYHPAKFRNGTYEECDYLEMEGFRDG